MLKVTVHCNGEPFISRSRLKSPVPSRHSVAIYHPKLVAEAGPGPARRYEPQTPSTESRTPRKVTLERR